ncbi:hypothetical protein HMN09_00983200 [Mycena chlorophos]|uniref:Uncharacterized protein n=1 Tax=Mycena chlorophos TaxID=658473 RepID=A0A8H6SHM6_MYCCL|nr:hypothetical protein HMN09_00983200 [Mycena chlorophos]
MGPVPKVLTPGYSIPTPFTASLDAFVLLYITEPTQNMSCRHQYEASSPPTSSPSSDHLVNTQHLPLVGHQRHIKCPSTSHTGMLSGDR